MRIFIIAIVMLSFSTSAQSCTITPEVWLESPIKVENSSNNLRRATGSAEFAHGKFLNIKGTLLDSNCVPVVGAAIEIEQSSSGKNDGAHDPNFLYTGVSVTDNLGRYAFFTVKPEGQERYFRFSVHRQDMQRHETMMFLDISDANNMQNIIADQVAQENLNNLVAHCTNINKVDTCTFNITIDDITPYKSY